MILNPSLVRAGLLAAASFPIAGCGETAPSPPISFSYLDTVGGAKIETQGVRIEVQDSVRYRYRYSSASPSGAASSATLNRHLFGVEDGTFHIGATRYGAAPAGAVIRVSDSGVFVNGERRGDVPPDVGEP